MSCDVCVVAVKANKKLYIGHINTIRPDIQSSAEVWDRVLEMWSQLVHLSGVGAENIEDAPPFTANEMIFISLIAQNYHLNHAYSPGVLMDLPKFVMRYPHDEFKIASWYQPSIGPGWEQIQ